MKESRIINFSERLSAKADANFERAMKWLEKRDPFTAELGRAEYEKNKLVKKLVLMADALG